MATYIALIDFTKKGIQSVQESPDRAEGLVAKAEAMGIDVQGLYWTLGAHDGVLVLDAPDDETATAFFLTVAQAGNVRTETLRAYDKDEIRGVVSKMA